MRWPSSFHFGSRPAAATTVCWLSSTILLTCRFQPQGVRTTKVHWQIPQFLFSLLINMHESYSGREYGDSGLKLCKLHISSTRLERIPTQYWSVGRPFQMLILLAYWLLVQSPVTQSPWFRRLDRFCFHCGPYSRPRFVRKFIFGTP